MKKLLTKVHWLCAVLLAATLLQPGLGVAQKSGGGEIHPLGIIDKTKCAGIQNQMRLFGG